MPQPALPTLHAYLSFPGTCEAAMRHYEQVLGAKLEALVRFRDAPPEMPPAPGQEDQVMHARLVHPGFELMAGDVPAGMPFQGIQGVTMTLSYPTADEARSAFDRLSAGGQVTVPMCPSFWAEVFGMCTDRYGVPWIINGALKPLG
jgi:PhnB protein